ncbi:MAG: molybdopterin converting factor subunit 1 [Gammaproteobacteria bacterium]|nr:molybdopterin converting factor subunit 1 [Gammaproteobacteria bacterium]
MVQILYFAQLRERLGMAREHLALPSGVEDVRSLIAALRQRGAPWGEVLRDAAQVRIAVNCAMASAETTVADGDEVAFFPPMTGG